MKNEKIELNFLQTLERLQKNNSYSAYSALSNLLGSPGNYDLKPLRIAIVRNFTIEPLLPVLKGEASLSGFFPELYVGDFDAIAADVFNAESPLYQHNPDFIIIAQWLDALSSALTASFLSCSTKQIEDEIERLAQMAIDFFNAIRKNTSAPILINNFPLPDIPTLGILDAQSEQYQIYSVIKLNTELLKVSKRFKDVYWVDFFSLFSRVGRESAFDARHWQMARAPLGKNALVPLGQEYGKLIRALRGKIKKCLVLDCDNTLWGGVIGEDGLSGIKVGLTYPGSAYLAFQQEILNLYHRGVILALCSKNNESDVMEVFREHPDMLLKENHFATRQVNWDDKATNLARIAEDLNLGIDSLVFVDDSAFECDWVGKQLPQVAVIQLDGKISSYRSLLSSSGYFDTLTFSEEDRKRSRMYVQAKERKQLLQSASSLENYLLDLQLQAEIGIPGKNEIPRISQLTQKTNQFNLTTQRYTEGEIQSFVEAPHSEVYYLRLADRISDLGIVGVVILKFVEKQAEIDALLLSCRALGRGAEKTLLNYAIIQAINHGCTHVLGKFLPTKKNAQVADFYEKHRFQLVRRSSEDSNWIYHCEQKKTPLPYPPWILVKTIE